MYRSSAIKRRFIPTCLPSLRVGFYLAMGVEGRTIGVLLRSIVMVGVFFEKKKNGFYPNTVRIKMFIICSGFRASSVRLVRESDERHVLELPGSRCLG